MTKAALIKEVTEEHYPYAVFNQAAVDARKRAIRKYIREHKGEVERIRREQ